MAKPIRVTRVVANDSVHDCGLDCLSFALLSFILLSCLTALLIVKV
jgi:hypothetical protein